MPRPSTAKSVEKFSSVAKKSAPKKTLVAAPAGAAVTKGDSINGAVSTDQFFKNLPEDRKECMIKLRDTIRKNIPAGFMETMSYKMPGWVVPHSTYPAGYHCSKGKLPLPMLSINSNKNDIVMHHMGLYMDSSSKSLMTWFTKAIASAGATVDMGKGCMRMKPESIPYALLGELVSKTTPAAYIAVYEASLAERKGK